MTYRARNIAIAVGLALIAALLTTFYVANYKRHVRASESTVKVFVAKKDVAQGTPGTDLLKQGWITTADVAQRSVVPGAISSPEQIASLLTSETIYAGEQITLRRFATKAEQGIRSQLHGTLRAVSLPGTTEQLLAGTLKDGDHVDVITNIKSEGGGCTSCTAVRVIARNVLVLKAPVVTTGTKVSGTNTSVMLAVSERYQAQKIFFAYANEDHWSLQLRPVAKVIDSPEDIETTLSLLTDNHAKHVKVGK
jgi:Flp pilus assembly protein CpaB